MKLELLGYLAIALALSVVLNVALGWQWAQARQECRADMEAAARIGIENERKRSARADKTTLDTLARQAKVARQQAEVAQAAVNEREIEIRRVVTRGDCGFPHKLPSIQRAIDAANTAAGD